MNATLLRQFAHPSSQYRGKPFWAWNGKLEEPELRRQIRLMHRMGLGGFFMHSRVGLATPYLSPEWFRLVGACVDEARKLGMEAWLYDEDRWPSGAAGGLVTKNQKYRMRSLMVHILDKAEALKWTPATVAVFTARLDGAAAFDVHRVPQGRLVPQLAAGEKLMTFVVELQECCSWYNGYTYLDTLSHAAVRAFIKATHEAYKKHNGQDFGGVIPGIFTDEPNHGNKLDFDNNTGHPGGLPWTGALLKTFQKRYGYDLVPHLMELVFDVDGRGMRPARLHYHDWVTHLYVDAFSRQIGEWCARNKLLFTGHQLAEDSLSSQTNMVGSCLRSYEFMQAPGMDLLTEHWRIYDTAKQVSSGARQFGRKWRLTETYGCTGWDFPLAGHKALGDWQAALGINLRCQHLAWYTMEGEAKRDYPAAIFYQSPWWELYPKVEDYFARINALMTRGEEVRDILVVHPVESMWMMCRAGWRNDEQVQAYDRMIKDLRDSLLTAHLDFDYGDEEILARHARVVAGKKRPVLHVGKAVYSTVVVPPLKTMRRSTFNLLKRFAASGGVVIFAGEPAGYVDAEGSEDVRRFAAGCARAPARGAGLAAAVAKSGRRVSIADPAGREIGAALYLLREDRAAFYLFLCNTGHQASRLPPDMDDIMVRDRRAAFPEVRVTGFKACAGAPLECNPETGAVVTADAVRKHGQWTVRTSLPALASRLFVIPKRKLARRFPRPPVYREIRRQLLSRTHWPIVLSEPNVLALDWPRYRVGSGTWRPADEILRVDREIRKHLKIPERGGAMVQPWARKADPASRRGTFELAYVFEVAALPKGPLFLALEQPRRFRVEVNGEVLSPDAECGWWVDLSLRKLPVDPVLLRAGRNEIHLAGEYDTTHPGLEIVYLLGEFGVKLRGAAPMMTARPDTLKIGDWCRQGLTFYAGSVSYQCSLVPDLRKGERLFIQVPSYRGVAVRVVVNGRPAGVMAWNPNEVEVTEFLAPQGQSNLLQIEVIGHRRNSHGPLHLDRKWPVWTGPFQFQNIVGAAYQLVPCGLMAPPRLSVRKV
ncbi:MAG: hypothetical protein KKG09_06740 [Verrucomicrobia bacterium]|nr:hypothetical protein [Verrucomicrobiota bacterium]MBU4247802.1 hypothetical protein [Verrucomicrobiota bacterium]MBU4292090.1 hypothetical protein [Verrucomicrobiota bacterium]MBU4497680.1 hypothetical protein [Verrucomicrobiota bacterium]MCG2681022.1 hypothetical protein [Kiritimatiellia bacterium]